MATKNKSEKKQHIQVFTRVRPLNAQELRSQVVVECINSKAVSVRDKCQTKTFTFDRVFGPDSKQVEVYKAVVSPLISEVLQGYNCTVFAYGQTGTGKTFTMVGEKSDYCSDNWENDPNCGVIPRTLSHLFDELKVRADEFTVRVSFLELYNEELCDLLAPNDGDDGKSLKLFEDSMKKGSVIVSGLEERTVHNKDDVYAILEAGNLRRQTATTLMNAQSSRSHTIFTITVHIKVTTPEGEDLIKTGKLNLVDLAGSENIGRSGAVDMRAREAGNINQSLLTLGRVITSLVERGPHVPYRESKLTRILQDSLGGRTKTSIIATVSPALCNIEETLSTFDYAHRARNITNKPEINQKTSKHVLLKEYTEEIERLRRDLNATREKHGVYLASENYNAILSERENLNKELVSKLQLLKLREDELKKQEEILTSLNMNLYATQNELAATSQKLEEATKRCLEKEDMLCELSKQTDALLKTADEAINDAQTLHDRLAKSRKILEQNYNTAEKFKSKFCWNLSDMKNRTNEFLAKGIDEVENQIAAEQKFVRFLLDNQTALKHMTKNIIKKTSDQIEITFDTIIDQINSSESFINDQLTVLKSAVDSQNQKAQEIIFNLTEHASKMKSDRGNLLTALESNRKVMESQSADIQQIHERLMNLTKMTLALPAIYNEKLKQRDEALKFYAEKCEFLEKKHSSARKQINDFGHTLYKMAQDHVKLLQKESECDEALKTVQNDQKYEEEKLFNELTETMHKNFMDMNNHAEEIVAINEKIGASSAEVIKNSTNFILPLVNNMATTEDKQIESMEVLVKNSFSAIENDFVELKKLCEAQSKKSSPYLKNVENKSSEMLETINNLTAGVNENSDILKAMAENVLQENLSKNQIISSQITDYSNEIFTKIHSRIKEIESFFSENIKRYETTGNTPQRKEFNYPRNILRSINKITGSGRQNESQSQVTDVNDTIEDDSSINKENISNP